jgi:hypothetical protein
MPQKTICYTGIGAITKNGNHTEKQFRKVMKRNKNALGVNHKSCSVTRKSRKCRSCREYKIVINKRLFKQLNTKKEQDITKKEEQLWEKCKKCRETGLKPCTLKQYMDFVGAEPMKCPENAAL